MKLRHKEKGYTINILSKHGKPILNKLGLVTASGKGYKGFEKFPEEVIEEKFEVVVC